jgi:acetyl esterase/lipase
MGFAVLNIDYRLAPTSLAPASVEDCRCALNWVIRHAEEYYFDPTRIVLTGHSVGGHLALITGMLPYDPNFDGECAGFGESGEGILDSFRITAIINWYGPTDVSDLITGENARNWAQKWLGTQPNRREIARSVSPLIHVRPNLPPVLTVHGDQDSLVPYQHAVRLHSALQDAGVPNRLITVRDGKHGGFSEEEILHCYMEIRRFLQNYMILRINGYMAAERSK